jgi:hypothetical protein
MKLNSQLTLFSKEKVALLNKGMIKADAETARHGDAVSFTTQQSFFARPLVVWQPKNDGWRLTRGWGDAVTRRVLRPSKVALLDH